MVQIGCHYIGGRWIRGSGTEFSSINPATGQSIWEGTSASSHEVTSACKAAREAQGKWGLMSVNDRINSIEQFKENLTKKKDTFAETISKETGKPLWETKQEVMAMINKIPISIEAYRDRCKTMSQTIGEKKSMTQFKPHGVVAILGPFNFPGHLPNGHIVPALLAGNTIVFKPSELTPLVGQELIKIWEMSHLPEGVLNGVQGDRQVGELIARNPELNGLFFTGSAAVGKELSILFGKQPNKILALEMGGNNPLIIDKVANIPGAVYTTIQSAYITAGQRCSCARRLIMVSNRSNDIFLDTLIKAIKQIKVGAYTTVPEPFMGPVISLKASKKLQTNEEWLIHRGAKKYVGLTELDPNKPFLTPGLIDVTEVRNGGDEEWFGPLLRVIKVKDLQEAIAEANQTEYGLSASILTDDREAFETVFKNVRAGIINWNAPTTGASSKAPFGGVGISGNFRPSAYFAADYCAYPVVSTELSNVQLPEKMSPGLPTESFYSETKIN